MNIAILGTRGIPNNYGGFEQFAEYLAAGLVKKGHRVTVYDSSSHPYQEDSWQGIDIVHVYDPESAIGTAGQFVYDFLSILDTRKKQFDIIYQLGYTSSSLFFGLHPSNSIVVTNMDGLEWKRSKYSRRVQKYLHWAESVAVKKSDYLVSDSQGIKKYLENTYNVESTYLPYGTDIFTAPDEHRLDELKLQAYQYNMLIARLEPENSIEIILDGVIQAEQNLPFIVVGNHNTKFGRYLKTKYGHYDFIKFTGGIYDKDTLNNLRYFSKIYFHGHTVGGTNPSLLEAMAAGALICAHNNEFNSAILGDNGFYFSNTDDVTDALINIIRSDHTEKIRSNLDLVRTQYTWAKIVDDYESFFQGLLD